MRPPAYLRLIPDHKDKLVNFLVDNCSLLACWVSNPDWQCERTESDDITRGILVKEMAL